MAADVQFSAQKQAPRMYIFLPKNKWRPKTKKKVIKSADVHFFVQKRVKTKKKKG